MTRAALVMALLCLAPLGWAEPSLHTQALLLTANALVYFDADPRAPRRAPPGPHAAGRGRFAPSA
ncbi:hypothetical protein [Pseudomonas indica]|uniref:hypothetical protein n=1 Tax=Pseudomonas indica TaxID=137658 RepID=UPI001140AACE|nr:hypothetical protein [Pseudomonas indica]